MKIPVGVALLSAGIALSAQAPSGFVQSQPARPTFRTGINAVLVDVRVVDRTGRFISDLSVDDFQVFEDGREQPITTFELVDLPTPPGSAASAIADASPRPDVSSNAGLEEGRLYVIVLDDIFGNAPQVSTRLGGNDIPPATLEPASVARELIFRMADTDRAAVVTTTGRRDMSQEFTNDRARLLTTVDRFVANQGQDPDFPREASAYARSSMGPNPFVGDLATVHDAMQSLKDIANWLGHLEGRRKAIVLVSQRLIGVSGNIAVNNWSRNAGLQNLERSADMRDLIEATSRANVSIYTLSPMLEMRPGNTLPFPDEYVEAMRESQRTTSVVSISQATGGFSRMSDFEGVFERIASENGSYYLLGFVSQTREDGKFHRLEVRARRPDLGVRARAGYVARPKPALKDSMIPNDTPLALAEALQSPASLTALPLGMSAVPYRGADAKPFLSVIVDLEDAKPDSHYEVAIVAAPINAKAADVRRITVNGGTVTSRLDLKSGRYHVRTAAVDMVGDRRGSVLFDVEVPDFSKGRLTMSGVVLGSSGGARPNTVGSDQTWKDRLGMPPTTRRAFDADEDLRGYVEVYDNSGGASEIEIETTVRDDAGTVQFSGRQRSVVAAARTASRAHEVRFAVPLNVVSPGRAVLIIEAQLRGVEGSATRREIPIAVRSVPLAKATSETCR